MASSSKRRSFVHEFKKHHVRNVQKWSFFWFLLSHIRMEYGYLRSKSPYSVQITENTDQENLYLDTFHAVKE